MSLPRIRTRIPGPRSKRLTRDLHRYECPHITYVDRDTPVFWEKSKGPFVTDVDGNRYLDMTSAFAVSSLGHGPAFLKKAMIRQIHQTFHVMGDIYPHRTKLEASKRLARLLPWRHPGLIFSSSGSEAVESALKTAYLATGKPAVIAFKGSYHGLGYGSMQTTHRKFFRDPFIRQSGTFVFFKDFILENSLSASEVDATLKDLGEFIRSRRRKIGAMIIEPIQGRGGIRVADRRFIMGLQKLSRRFNVMLIIDEVFTGFGRTGKMFAFEHFGLEPDILCLGKAAANGFPISVCAASQKTLKAWGPSPGEAKHTSTFLGNPLGCAMIAAVLEEFERGRYQARVNRLGRVFKKGLSQLMKTYPDKIVDVRGRGLMWGLVLRHAGESVRIVKKLLKRGVLVLPAGENSEVLSFTPPFVVSESQIEHVMKALSGILR